MKRDIRVYPRSGRWLCGCYAIFDALVTRAKVTLTSSTTLSALFVMLRSLFPSISRSAFRNPARSFHPLAGHPLIELQEKCAKPPSANLVPIVIEQTVQPSMQHLDPLLIMIPSLRYRDEENAPMTFSPASCEKESLCSTAQ